MKYILLLAFCLSFSLSAFAQGNSDSLAYQLQRKKINSMLDMRRKKFGEYDQSLTQHSGIFGMQTKNDIRRSNDILMDIVKADDDIFQQTKILLEYRTFQQKQVEARSTQSDDSNIGFMNEINKLRAQNEKLKNDAVVTEQERQKKAQMALFIIIALFVAVLFLLRRIFVKNRPATS
jgi:hypothetical protein